MSFNGSGSFLINTAGQPVVSGTVISSTAFNALTADLATGLSTCITKDGQTTVTANIPMANYKFTGLGAGSAAADSANLSQVQSTVVKLLASVSGTDTITAVGSPTVAAYAAGQMFYFVAAGDNTGAVTINIDSLGAKAVTRDGSVALAAGDIKSGEVVVIVYDGTRFQVVSQLNSSGDARFANVSIASALNVGGVATFSAGTAAAPAITTTGDTNTGIFFPAADTIAFAEGGVEAMRLNASGQLLVGATSTSNGTAFPGTFVATNSADTVGFTLRNSATATGTTASIFLQSHTSDGTQTGASRMSSIRQSAGGTDLAFFTTDNSSNNTQERLRIDSAGNLGLGVSPSAWSSFTALQVKNGSISSTGNDFNLMANAYYDGSNYKRIAASGAGRMYFNTDGSMFWAQAGSSTAGSTITFTQALTLDASGNLGVGTTSPSQRIHVEAANPAVYVKATSTGYSTSHFANNSGSSYFGRDDSSGSNFGTANTTAIYTSSAHPITFYTGGGEKARITSGGYFKASNDGNYRNATGIYHEFRQNADDTTLIVESTNASLSSDIIAAIADRNTTNNSFYAISYYNDGAAAYKFRVADSGNVTNTNGSYGTISDAKMKTDIVDANSQWDDVKALRFRKFKMKDDPSGITQLGVVAQEVGQVSPGLVEEHADRDAEGNDLGTTTKSVKTSVLLMKAAVALQEAMARIEKLEAEMAALKGA